LGGGGLLGGGGSHGPGDVGMLCLGPGRVAGPDRAGPGGPGRGWDGRAQGRQGPGPQGRPLEARPPGPTLGIAGRISGAGQRPGPSGCAPQMSRSQPVALVSGDSALIPGRSSSRNSDVTPSRSPEEYLATRNRRPNLRTNRISLNLLSNPRVSRPSSRLRAIFHPTVYENIFQNVQSKSGQTSIYS
jgi:hypothetical protein